MTTDEFVENIRQEIREEGFMASTKLAMLISRRAAEFGVNTIDGVIEMLPCDDIKKTEYANWLTRDYRRKDLYYYSPTNEF